MTRVLAMALAAWVLASCTCVNDPTGSYACTRNDQCIDGYRCLDATCQLAKTNRCPVVSCELAACEGLACTEGRYCQRGQCACIEAGGAPEVFELSCADGRDNDCDGRFDCNDADCAGACDGGVAPRLDGGSLDSGVLDSGVLDGSVPVPDAGGVDAGQIDAGQQTDAGAAETSCANGSDDDGDRSGKSDEPALRLFDRSGDANLNCRTQ